MGLMNITTAMNIKVQVLANFNLRERRAVH